MEASNVDSHDLQQPRSRAWGSLASRRIRALGPVVRVVALGSLSIVASTLGRAEPNSSTRPFFLPAVPDASLASYSTFDDSGDHEGWVAQSGIASLDVFDGVLSIATNGADPHLAGPRIEVDTATHHFLALRCRTNVAGTTEVYFGGGDRFVEGRRVSIEMQPTTDFVTYELDLRNVRAWSGCVDRLRIDPVNGANEAHARFELDWIAVYQAPPRLVPLLPRWKGADALVLGFENRGGWSIDTPVELWCDGAVIGRIDELREDTSSEVRIDASRFSATTWIEARYRGHAVWRGRMVRPPDELAPARGADSRTSISVVAGTGFVQDAEGRCVRLSPIASATLRAPDDVYVYYEFDPRPIGDASSALHRDVVRDPSLGDVVCDVRIDGTLVETTLSSCADLSVARFEGPRMRESAERSHALLPGLEYLEPGESSSSATWTGPAFANRERPPAFRVTAPMVAVEYERVTGLAPRDPSQKAWVASMSWECEESVSRGAAPVVEFRSDGSAASHASVFLPERAFADLDDDRFASEPLHLSAGDALVLRTTFTIERGTIEDVFARHWLPRAPVPPSLGFVDADERVEGAERIGAGTRAAMERVLATSLDAYTDSLFDGTNAWKTHIAIQEPHKVRPEMAATIVAEALRSGRPQLRERSRLAPGASLESLLGSAAALVGDASRAEAIAAFASMSAEGAVGYELTEEMSQKISAMSKLHGAAGDVLGERGATNAGLIAEKTLPLLQYAACTQDPIYVAAALRALVRMNSFTVPRGSQTWEVHADTPDLYAAALCARADLWGFRLTGDERYLDEAERWLATGLPFLYWWKPEARSGVRAVHVANERGEGPVLAELEPTQFYVDREREVLPYASIAVFGTSWYAVPWFGIPVQWCGLAWANAVREIDLVRPLPDYVRVADGVFRSAANQQCDAGYLAGTIPDSWDLSTNLSRQPYIVPRRLVEYAYRALRAPGIDAIEYERLDGSDWTHVATRSILEHVDARRDGVTIVARSYEGEDASLILGGPRLPVRSVSVGGVELTRGAGVGQFQTVACGGDRVVLVVRWRASALDHIEVQGDGGP